MLIKNFKPENLLSARKHIKSWDTDLLLSIKDKNLMKMKKKKHKELLQN